MIHVTCRLTATNRDELRNPALGNRVWATFTFFHVHELYLISLIEYFCESFIVLILPPSPSIM